IAVAALLSLPFAWIPALSPPGTSQAYLPGGGALLGPELLPFAAAGLVGLGSLLAAASRRGAAPNAEVTSGRGLGGFVLAWLAIEIAAALFFSHFSFFAGRRVVGFSVVALLAAGHFASRTRPRPAHVAGVAVWAGALGCLYFAADCSDAYARRALVDHLLERIEVEQGSPAAGTVWFTGHWSLQHYASAAGMKPLVPGRSRIEAGDWLVVPRGVSRQAFRPPPDALEAIGVVSSVSALPWSTIPGSYIGAIPIRRQPVAHVSAQLFRSRYGFVARARAAENDRRRAGDGPR
ncbi:MAG: hypothetical protein O7A09_05800, partial [Proteobacteria bacterium]|nr:hypothetical protein [Pseudomonadota bacterium]